MRPQCLSSIFLLTTTLAKAQSPSDAIRLNQLGFYPNAPKIAIVVGDSARPVPADPFQITAPDANRVLFTGTLGEPRRTAISGKMSRTADFSAFRQTGTFVLTLPGQHGGAGKRSYRFEIRPAVHRDLAIGALKGFYYQRVSTALPEPFAGIWSRPAGHPDTRVLVHPSAASAGRPAGTLIASPRGWRRWGLP